MDSDTMEIEDPRKLLIMSLVFIKICRLYRMLECFINVYTHASQMQKV